MKSNYIIDWDSVKVIDSYPNLFQKCVLGALQIRKRKCSGNRDEGFYHAVYEKKTKWTENSFLRIEI